MNIVLSAEDAAGIQMLRALLRRPHRIVAVMASPARPSSPRATVWDVAQQSGLPVWTADRLAEAGLADELRSHDVDILLNVHSLYRVHQQVLEALPLGGYNLHPGPLPRYAGLNSVSWALYHGEREHAVTVHRMAPEVDTGPIAFQEWFTIQPTDTGLSLSTRCVKVGVGLMLQVVDVAADDPAAIPATPQDLSQRRYFGRGVPQDGRLDWSRSAAAIADFVRACDYRPFPSPWGHPMTAGAGRAIEIIKVALTGEP